MKKFMAVLLAVALLALVADLAWAGGARVDKWTYDSEYVSGNFTQYPEYCVVVEGYASISHGIYKNVTNPRKPVVYEYANIYVSGTVKNWCNDQIVRQVAGSRNISASELNLDRDLKYATISLDVPGWDSIAKQEIVISVALVFEGDDDLRKISSSYTLDSKVYKTSSTSSGKERFAEVSGVVFDGTFNYTPEDGNGYLSDWTGRTTSVYQK